jgi:Zn-dependent M16 (insulinase) family peptidase
MIRYLTNTTDEYRQNIRDQIIGTKRADFKAFAHVLDELCRQGRVVVMGSRERLDEINETEGAPNLEIHPLL